MNKETEEYISLLQEIIDYWEVKWTKEHNDKEDVERKLHSLEAEVEILKNEIHLENKNMDKYVSHSHHNKEVYFWQLKWEKERDDRIFLEKRLRLAQMRLKLLGNFAQREIKNTSPEENADIINDSINYWAEGWAREQAENIRFEERLRFEQDQAEKE